MRVLGLDEAGRGSVLGPMAIGAFCCEAGAEPGLVALGAADSKALTRKRREAAAGRLREAGDWEVRLVSAEAIDAGNLNRIEEALFVELVLRHDPDRVVIDAPVHPRGVPALVARLRRAAGDREWVVEPKADARHPVVGAASILAKVARDAAIAELAERWGAVGSGYPSDPTTRAFLAGFLRRGEPLPPFVRSRWGTLDRLRQQVLFGG